MPPMKPVADPRPQATRQPSDVALQVVSDDNMGVFAAALRNATRAAIDTETVFVEPGPGALRVVSAATRDLDGAELAWVVDVTMVDRLALAEALSGVRADAWNADFDARVIERDLIEPARLAGRDVHPVVWWDAQLADALLHQGVTGFGFYHGLAWAAEWYLGIRAQGKGTTQLSYTANEPLSDEQLRYAGADAVETLWVADVIGERITSLGLERVCELEMRARPFLDHMERSGLPFDWTGWHGQLDHIERLRTETLTQLAELTGGGQGTLFSPDVEPSWNPGSESQTKDVLNRFAEAEVLRWTEIHTGERRLLAPTDPLRADTLAEIGGVLCQTLLAYREHAKILSTYGESIHDHLTEHGRIHPEYLQVVGTNTGRLASRNPNAQNFSPRMKPHFRPANGDRVFVYADLSQAELRFVAQLSGDAALRQAFADGVDVHVATAERMFGEDMTALRASNRPRYDELRAKAKRINFGIVYGQRGTGLARSLSQSGVPTTPDEGRDLLEAYLGAYPGVGAWCDDRDRVIDELANNPGKMDWVATMRLHHLQPIITARRRVFRTQHRRWPTVEEVQELFDHLSLDEVAWVMSFHAPVALTADGQPFAFDSVTAAGRRQRFTIHTEGILARGAATVIGSPKPGPSQIRLRLSERFNVKLESAPPEIGEAGISKMLEDRVLRRAVVDEVLEVMGLDALNRLLDSALRERVSRMANAYRNAPVQGGVADVMLDAYGMLHERLAAFEDTFGVQTVHDSVVVECPRAIAHDVARVVKDTLEDAMRRWCPDVAALADTDVRTSLSDSDVEFTIAPAATVVR
jgi:hypothetical protein